MIKKYNLGLNDLEAMNNANSLGVQYVPTLVIVNSDGSVQKTWIGPFTSEEVKAELSK